MDSSSAKSTVKLQMWEGDEAERKQPDSFQLGAELAAKQSFEQITSDMRGEIINLCVNSGAKGPILNELVANTVLGYILRVGKLFYHADKDKRDFESAMFFNSYEKHLLRIGSDAFASWLSRWVNINMTNTKYMYIFSAIKTASLSKEHSRPIVPESFWARRDGAIYLSNGDGQIVKITSEKIELVDNGTDDVLFAFGDTLAPWKLVEPKDPFTSCRLFRESRCKENHGKLLLQLWLYSIPNNPQSKPPLCLSGPVGSGKTRTLKGYAELMGMNFRAHKVEERNGEKDFWVSINTGGFLVLDNADTRCRWLADAVSAYATDGGTERRVLYTNGKDSTEAIWFRSRSFLGITTANPTFANDAGLADRLIVVRMDRQSRGNTEDAELGDEIQRERDAGLSHMANTLMVVLGDTYPVPKGINDRHPDFAAFAVRVGRALGIEDKAISALKTAELDKSAFCLENDPIGSALQILLDQEGEFSGTSADLLPKLKEIDEGLDAKPHQWTAKGLTKRLNRLWMHLEATFGAKKGKDTHTEILTFYFKKEGATDKKDVF